MSFPLLLTSLIVLNFLVRVFWLHLWLCTKCMSGAQGGQQKALDLPELVVSCHVGAGSETQVLSVLVTIEPPLQTSLFGFSFVFETQDLTI